MQSWQLLFLSLSLSLSISAGSSCSQPSDKLPRIRRELRHLSWNTSTLALRRCWVWSNSLHPCTNACACWHTSPLRNCILSDLYKPKTSALHLLAMWRLYSDFPANLQMHPSSWYLMRLLATSWGSLRLSALSGLGLLEQTFQHSVTGFGSVQPHQ